MRAGRPQNIACERQASFIQDRIISVEKHFSELCSAFAAYSRKCARLRDKNDELAEVIQNYAESENINKSLSNGLNQFTVILATVGNHQDTKVKRIDSRVVKELSQYEGICKNVKEELRMSFKLRDRELARRRQLDRMRERNPLNRQQISLAESELVKASADVSRTIKVLEEQADVFETKKLHDIREILSDFITSELNYHCRAIELFTKAYQQIQDINETEDLEEFRNVVNDSDTLSRLDTVKRLSFKNASSFSLASIFATPPSFKRSAEQGIPHSPETRVSKTLSTDTLRPGVAGSVESVQVEDYVDDESLSIVSDNESSTNNKIYTKNKP